MKTLAAWLAIAIPFAATAEVRDSASKSGKFDRAGDVLLDTQRLKQNQSEGMLARAHLVESLLKTPGATAVTQLDAQAGIGGLADKATDCQGHGAGITRAKEAKRAGHAGQRPDQSHIPGR